MKKKTLEEPKKEEDFPLSEEEIVHTEEEPRWLQDKDLVKKESSLDQKQHNKFSKFRK